MVDEPYDELGSLVTLKDRVSFGDRRYNRFKYATVYAIDGSFLGLLVGQSQSMVPASWVKLV